MLWLGLNDWSSPSIFRGYGPRPVGYPGEPYLLYFPMLSVPFYVHLDISYPISPLFAIFFLSLFYFFSLSSYINRIMTESLEIQRAKEFVAKSYSSTLLFYLNGKKQVVTDPNPNQTLIDYVRSIGLTGTKLGCAEGGCGACTVMVSSWDPEEQKEQ